MVSGTELKASKNYGMPAAVFRDLFEREREPKIEDRLIEISDQPCRLNNLTWITSRLPDFNPSLPEIQSREVSTELAE